MFSIAHELRHLWQYKTDKSYYFKDYKQANQLSIEDYNNQIAEIDANAFASIVMTDLFGLKPLYEGLTDENIKRIKTRINIILKTW